MSDKTTTSQDMLARLLTVITECQFECLVDQVLILAQYGFGEVSITWTNGKPDMVQLRGSVKIKME